MRRPRDEHHHQIFLAGLALASAACSTYHSAPPDGHPLQEPPSATGDITDPAAVELAKVFSSADPQAALPGIEIVGVVEDRMVVDVAPTCSVTPCDPTWLKLAENGGRRVVIMRRNGSLAALSEVNFREVLGPLDSAAKVALRMQVETYDPPATCGRLEVQRLACADGADSAHVPVRAVEGGAFEVITFGHRDVCMGGMSGEAIALGVVKVSADGEVTRIENDLTRAAAEEVRGQVNCFEPSRGRMFEGFVRAPSASTELAYFVKAAREEAAAAIAFERLAVELSRHAAPLELIEAARSSAVDERRHAELFLREARLVAEAVGVAKPELEPEPEPRAFEPRPLLAMLLENAREGCANETYAALVATHQAGRTVAPRLRAALESIAEDERDHAILAHRIHVWGASVLPAAEARELATCQQAAYGAMLRCSPTPLALEMNEPPPELVNAAFRHVVDGLAAILIE